MLTNMREFNKQRWRIPILGVTLLELVVMVALVWFIRGYVFQLFRVHGPSMCPTLNQLEKSCNNGSGELVFVNQALYSFQREPKRGEVVVFRSPHQDIYVIKRVIGIPGDEFEIKNGKVRQKNKETGEYELLEEPYLNSANQGKTRTFGREQFSVAEGQYFLLGDNRGRSQDGRQCYSPGSCAPDDLSTIPLRLIKGRAELVLFPFDKIRKVETYFKTLANKN